jgi:hypothetical protein
MRVVEFKKNLFLLNDAELETDRQEGHYLPSGFQFLLHTTFLVFLPILILRHSSFTIGKLAMQHRWIKSAIFYILIRGTSAAEQR